MHHKQQMTWIKIANVLEGRTDNSIKNHWNCNLSKKIEIMNDCYQKYEETIVKTSTGMKKELILTQYLRELQLSQMEDNKEFYETLALEWFREEDSNLFLKRKLAYLIK